MEPEPKQPTFADLLLEAYRGFSHVERIAVWVGVASALTALILGREPNYDALSAWGTLAAATVAGIAAITAIRTTRISIDQAKLSLSAPLVLQLEDRFNTEDMLRTRENAARFLRGDTDADAQSGLRDTRKVLNFFQTVANLANRGAVFPELVADQFGLWMKLYWVYAGKHVAFDMEGHRTAWADVDKLLRKLDREHGPPPSERMLRTYLYRSALLMA